MHLAAEACWTNAGDGRSIAWSSTFTTSSLVFSCFCRRRVASCTSCRLRRRRRAVARGPMTQKWSAEVEDRRPPMVVPMPPGWVWVDLVGRATINWSHSLIVAVIEFVVTSSLSRVLPERFSDHIRTVIIYKGFRKCHNRRGLKEEISTADATKDQSPIELPNRTQVPTRWFWSNWWDQFD